MGPVINNSPNQSVKSTTPEDVQPDSTTAEQTSEPAVKQEDTSKTKEASKQGAKARAGEQGLAAGIRSKDIHAQFDRTTVEDVFSKDNVMQAAPNQAAPKLPPHATEILKGVQNSKGLKSPLDTMVKGDSVQHWNQAISEVKDTMKKVGDLMANGNYGQAKQELDDMMKKKFMPVNNNGETVLDGMKGVDIAGVQAIKTMSAQLGFLEKMEKAGIKASMPPTEQQLKSYFATFKSEKPDQTKIEGAKQALGDYMKAFHVHPAHATNNSAADVDYKPNSTQKMYAVGGKVFKTNQEATQYATANNITTIVDIKMKAPDNWAEVTTKRTTDKNGEFAGRTQNDCEGYAYLSATLLQEAGFKLEGFVTGNQSNGQGHVMAVFKKPDGKPLVTSNDESFDVHNVRLEGDAKRQMTQLLDAGWTGAAALGVPDFYLGSTSGESQSYALAKDPSRAYP